MEIQMSKFQKKMILLVLTWFLAAYVFGQDKKSLRWKIQSVVFINNEVYSDQRLRRLMMSRPPSLFGSTDYQQDILEEDLNNIALFYHQNGYLEARIIDSDVKMDSSQKKVHISVALEEGLLTRIEGVGVLGNRTFADNKLLDIIKLRPDDPFLRRSVERATLTLLRFYADQGFLEADVEPQALIDSVDHRAILDFRIREGHQSFVADIYLDGLEKTKPAVVFRELLFKRGEVLDYSRLLESQRRIYMTGLFQSVFVRPVIAGNGDSTKKDIRIELKENPSIELNVSAGYGSVERLRGKVEVFNKNIRGSAQKVGLITTMSFIHRGVEGSFTEPKTFGTPWRTDVNLGTEYKEEPGYHLNQTGGRLTVGRPFLKRSNIMTRFRIQRGKLSEVEVEEIPDNVKTDIRSLEVILNYDSRDNLFNATRGFYAEWRSELGGSFKEKVNGFVRLNIELKYYHSTSPKTVIASAVELGWMESQGGLPEIPLSERFYAGGPNSARGFQYQKLGPLDADGTPLGGRLKFVWHIIEIRHHLYKMFDGAVFLDAGNVWSTPESFRIRDLRFSPGIGLRLNTPIGVGRIDLGMNLARRPGEPRYVWSFSMGQVI